MSKIIIADSSCLILLDKIGELSLLPALYGQVHITKEVAGEYGKELPPWVVIEEVRQKEYIKLIERDLDLGEAASIALALEHSDPLIILDDLKARKYTQQLGIKMIGTFGVILKAKLSGNLDAVKPIIEKIQDTNFRISQQLIDSLLKACDE